MKPNHLRNQTNDRISEINFGQSLWRASDVELHASQSAEYLRQFYSAVDVFVYRVRLSVRGKARMSTPLLALRFEFLSFFNFESPLDLNLGGGKPQN